MYYKKIINKLIICLGVVFLSSCASTSNITPTVYDKKNINPEDVRLVFNRKKTLLLFQADALIEINGQNITKLSNGSSFYYDMPAGRTNIQVHSGWDKTKFSIDLNLIKSKIYEFEIEPNYTGFNNTALWGVLGDIANAKVKNQGAIFVMSIKNYIDK